MLRVVRNEVMYLQHIILNILRLMITLTKTNSATTTTTSRNKHSTTQQPVALLSKLVNYHHNHYATQSSTTVHHSVELEKPTKLVIMNQLY